jgi:hypothetical protein
MRVSSRNESWGVLALEKPDPARIASLLRQYAPVRLPMPSAHLAAADRAALAKLVEAGRWIDRIFWKQHSPAGSRLVDVVFDDAYGWPREFRRLLHLNFGPWNGFDGDRPFWGDEPRPRGGSLYPPRLTQAQLERYLAEHAAQREALLSRTTLIEEHAGRLRAIPYTQAYRRELSHIRRCLVAASETATHEGFRRYLRARAEGLYTGALQESETLWINHAQDCAIDVAIGPYEVYDDDLMGLKTAYESIVLVRHSARALEQLEAIAPEVERLMPGGMSSAHARRRVLVGMYDVVHAAGLANMGGKAVAATLPNDEDIRTRVGARLLIFRNVVAAKFEPIVKPLAARVLQRDQLGYVRESAFLEHTVLHEISHALSTCFVWRNGMPTQKAINEALGERYSTIDECRADLVGMVYLDLLTQRGAFTPEMHTAGAVTFVANLLRSLRFGIGDAYSEGSAITLSYLLRSGAVAAGVDERLSVDVERTHRAVRELAARVQAIATGGDYSAAGKLIDELAGVPPQAKRLLERVADIPIDLEFVFDESDAL